MILPPKSKKLCSRNPPHPIKYSHTNDSLDRISNLPNVVLYRIIALLPTKHVVGTTILSKRWVGLWTSALTTSLDLHDVLLLHQETPNISRDKHKTLFAKFVDYVLPRMDLPCVTRFSLYCFNSYGSSRVTSWLQKGYTHNIKELDIFVAFDEEPISLPSTVFTSTSLVVLKLSANVKLDIPSNGVCFPSLKVLNVFVYNQTDDVWRRRLYSSCPVPKDLVLGGEMLYESREVEFRVVSSSLKRLRINFTLAHGWGLCLVIILITIVLWFGRRILCPLMLMMISWRSIMLVTCWFLMKQMFVLDIPLWIIVGAIFILIVLFGFLEQVKSLSLSGCTTGALSHAQDTRYVEDDEDDDYYNYYGACAADRDGDGDGDGDGEDDNVHDDGNMEYNDFIVPNEDGDFVVPNGQYQIHSFPKFICLTHLEFGFLNCSSWTLLPNILEHSPNLEFLS